MFDSIIPVSVIIANQLLILIFLLRSFLSRRKEKRTQELRQEERQRSCYAADHILREIELCMEEDNVELIQIAGVRFLRGHILRELYSNEYSDDVLRYFHPKAVDDYPEVRRLYDHVEIEVSPDGEIS